MSELVERPTLLSETEYQKMSPQEKETYIKEVLKKTLQLNSNGLTVTKMPDTLQYDRRIIKKRLVIMKVTNEVYTVTLGVEHFSMPNNKAIREATSQSKKFRDDEYQVYTLKNRLGEFAVLQQKNMPTE